MPSSSATKVTQPNPFQRCKWWFNCRDFWCQWWRSWCSLIEIYGVTTWNCFRSWHNNWWWYRGNLKEMNHHCSMQKAKNHPPMVQIQWWRSNHQSDCNSYKWQLSCLDFRLFCRNLKNIFVLATPAPADCKSLHISRAVYLKNIFVLLFFLSNFHLDFPCLLL